MPFQLDISLLIERGDDFESRAKDIKSEFDAWMKHHAERMRENSTYKEYVEQYGRFSPIVVLALPRDLARDKLPLQIGDARMMALVATGRLIIFDVSLESKQSAGGETGWRNALVQKNYYPSYFRDNAIDVEKFDGLTDHMGKVFRKLLKDWKKTKSRRSGEVGIPTTPDGEYTFVSYAHANGERVRAICDALVAEKVGLWIDDPDIRGGEDWIEAIVSAIDGAKAVLPFCSKEHSDSTWCYREVVYADGEKKHIAPAWLTNPALFGKMKILLQTKQATMVGELSAKDAAKKIKPTLNG